VPDTDDHVIAVLLVDDDDLMRAGLRMIIEQTGDLIVAAEAANGYDAIALARSEPVDIVLMDVRMPELDGIEATRQITAPAPEPLADPPAGGRPPLRPPPRVIILTTFELDSYVFSGLRAGASGFLLKRTPPEQLLDGIRTVAAGDSLLSPSVTRRLIEEFARRPAAEPANPRLAGLTDREREVLIAMARGWSNAEIADQLFIADNTVKTHVKRILTKLDARDRVQAVVMAYEAGLMG
jgi:DNA-binding NarL/FixJ family response regulator